MKLLLADIPVAERQSWLQHAIAPRPIGLVSSVNREKEVNLAPFSFFNLFSSEPPVVIFSPARRVRDNSVKHTFKNMYEVKEVVINIVTYDMVQQVSLASCDYPAGVDEFVKAGFTKEKASMVQPPMVKESPVKMECKVTQIQPLGKSGGAGNLIIAEVLCLHVSEEILNAGQTMIDQQKVDHVARLGGDWYCRVSQQNLFRVAKPNKKLGIGMDALPDKIKNSCVLTNNHLAQLANVEAIPLRDDGYGHPVLNIDKKEKSKLEIHRQAKFLIDEGRTEEAWQVLLADY